MNKLFIILLVFLFSCGKMESYNERGYNYMEEISTDSLIQKSKANFKRLLSNSKHEHHYADSVSSCLDSIQHELELRENQLNQVQQQQVSEVMAYEIHAVKSYEMVEMKEVAVMGSAPYYPDTVFVHDTIYLDTFATIKETIIKLELMTDKDKAKLKKKREKNKHKKAKFK